MTAAQLRSLLRAAPVAAERARAIAVLDVSSDLQFAFEALLETGQLSQAEAVSLLHELKALAAPQAHVALVTPHLEQLRNAVNALMETKGSDLNLLEELENADRQIQIEDEQCELDSRECTRLSERIHQMNSLIKDAENALGRPVAPAL
jgi:hypothetical protein